jgi:hypothetical protein
MLLSVTVAFSVGVVGFATPDPLLLSPDSALYRFRSLLILLSLSFLSLRLHALRESDKAASSLS